MVDFTDEAEEARSVLIKEADSIKAAAERLCPRSFAEAVDILFKTTGKIIITGIGKSGHVGKKMAALFCSTGSPACFLHPSEAVHGDLGIHQEGDPVIYLSNSGATPELLYLEPVLRARSANIIGIMGKRESPLGSKVDVFLDASVQEEVDPLGIVPTASFAVVSSLGDALAAALMRRRGFDETEYAKTHPAGQLGRNLILKVRDVMHLPEKIACLSSETSIKEVVIAMSRFPLGAACILEQEKLVGIITDGDLRRALEKDQDLFSLKAGDIMSAHPETITADEPLGSALRRMEERKPTPVSLLPVTEHGVSEDHFIGLIRLHDVLGS